MDWKRIKNWWIKNQEKNSDEYIEREELKKSLEEYRKDISVIMNARFHEQFSGDRAFNMASIIQNLHTQKKLTKVTDSLKNATWILALATGIFAWVEIKNSSSSNEIISTLQGIVSILVSLFIIFIILNLIWKFIKFIFKKFK